MLPLGAIPFTTPGKGILTVEIGQFQGDWDLYVFESGGIIAAAESDQIVGAPATEKIMVPLEAKRTSRSLPATGRAAPRPPATTCTSTRSRQAKTHSLKRRNGSPDGELSD